MESLRSSAIPRATLSIGSVPTSLFSFIGDAFVSSHRRSAPRHAKVTGRLGVRNGNDKSAEFVSVALAC